MKHSCHIRWICNSPITNIPVKVRISTPSITGTKHITQTYAPDLRKAIKFKLRNSHIVFVFAFWNYNSKRFVYISCFCRVYTTATIGASTTITRWCFTCSFVYKFPIRWFCLSAVNIPIRWDEAMRLRPPQPDLPSSGSSRNWALNPLYALPHPNGSAHSEPPLSA